MADPLPPSPMTPDDLIEYIARGHAFEKHVMGFDLAAGMHGVNAFSETQTRTHFDKATGQTIPPARLGNNLFIETPDDLKHYIKNCFLTSPHTSGYISPIDGSVNLYNSDDNVAMHFSWKNSSCDFGTVYRYADTPYRFVKIKEQAENQGQLQGKPFIEFDNGQNPRAVANAIDTMIADMHKNPGKYLFDPKDPSSTVQNRILANANRPGRTWTHDEVLNAPHNVRGHSRAYAKAHNMDIPEAEFVRVEQEMENEFNIGRVRKAMRSQKIARMLIVDPGVFVSLYPTTNADSEQESEATIEAT